MKLALIAFILFPLIAFTQIDENKINTYTIEGGKLDEVASRFITEMGKTHVFTRDKFPRKSVAPKVFKNCTIEDVFTYLMEGTDMELKYYRSSGYVRIVERSVSEKIFIEGVVESHDDGGGISGVTVSTPDMQFHTTTAQDGHYLLEINKNAFDTLHLQFSHVAFIQVSGILVLSYYMNKDHTIINKVMKPKVIELRSYDVKRKINYASGFNTLNRVTLKDYISSKEELNASKFAMMPGSDQFFRQEGGISFRGSQSDMSYFMLEGRRVKNPFKDRGQLPVFGKSAIKNVTIYEGVSPAKYEGAAVIFDIKAGDGNLIKPDFDLSVSDKYAEFTFSGPIETEASSFLINFRSSYYPALLQRDIDVPSVFNSPFNLPTDFTDGMVKLTAKRDYNRFTFFANYASETIRENVIPLAFENTLSFQNIQTDEMDLIVEWENTDLPTTNIKLSSGISDFTKGLLLRSTLKAQEVNPVGEEKSFFVKGSLFTKLNNQISVESGFVYDNIRYNLNRAGVPEESLSGLRKNTYTSLFLLFDDIKDPVNKLALYSQLEGTFNDFYISMGLRYSSILKDKHTNMLEPRVLLKYVPPNRPNSTIEFKYGKMAVYDYSLQMNSAQTFSEFPFIISSLNQSGQTFRPHSFHEIDLNFKIQALGDRLYLNFGHFAKFSKDQLLSDEDKVDTVFSLRQENGRSSLLGVSISGGFHLDNAMELSFMMSLKDSSKEVPKPFHFDYKFGFNIGKNFLNIFDVSVGIVRFRDLLFEGESKDDASVFSGELKLSYSPNERIGFEVFLRYFDSEIYHVNPSVGSSNTEIGLSATLSL